MGEQSRRGSCSAPGWVFPKLEGWLPSPRSTAPLPLALLLLACGDEENPSPEDTGNTGAEVSTWYCDEDGDGYGVDEDTLQSGE